MRVLVPFYSNPGFIPVLQEAVKRFIPDSELIIFNARSRVWDNKNWSLIARTCSENQIPCFSSYTTESETLPTEAHLRYKCMKQVLKFINENVDQFLVMQDDMIPIDTIVYGRNANAFLPYPSKKDSYIIASASVFFVNNVYKPMLLTLGNFEDGAPLRVQPHNVMYFTMNHYKKKEWSLTYLDKPLPNCIYNILSEEPLCNFDLYDEKIISLQDRTVKKYIVCVVVTSV